jgi:methyl-accepting chemotaxis protein
MFLRKLRIGNRLAVGFGLILAAMVLVTLGSAWLGKDSRDRLAAAIASASAKEQLAIEMKTLALEQSSAMRNIGLHAEILAMQMEEDQIRRLSKAFDETRDRLMKRELAPNERAILQQVGKLDAEYDAPVKQALGLATSFQLEAAAKVLMREVDPIVNKQLSELDSLVQLQRAAYQEAMQASSAEGDRLMLVTAAFLAIIVLAAALLAWAVTRSITRPIATSVDVARRVASGDLTSKVETAGRDEAAQLLTALRDMNDGLGVIVTGIRTGSESIAVGAGQVAAGNQQLSSRTEEHASSLEETASTLEEFTTTVRQNADRAKEASRLAGSASETAEKGGAVVAKVVSTMHEVTASSKRITDIIGVIDGISFQTNILALNAAVEAARAGEQGRGFAVVASEVRSLAQRSAASAKEIRGLIEDTVNRTEAGGRLVEQAGRTMEELVASVRKVALIMSEIAAASDEQSSGIEQINRAITQMDTVVQMNASLVEQATAAATSMASQASGLARSVAQFRVEASTAISQPLAANDPPALAHGEGAPAGRRPMLQGRREPALAAGEDEWKEF